MTISIYRTADAWWAGSPDAAANIDTDAATTAQLLADRPAIDRAAASTETVPVSSLELLSPVTAPCRVVAQMTNFASHVKDTGGDPKKVPLTFFRKASGSITGPVDDIVKPEHVRLLDYEVEIGLVIGRDMPVGTAITADNLAGYICGLVVTNDVSARDVQLTKTQFYESKSYPTFTPVGPALVLLDADELNRFGELRLQLRVNGELRQDSTVDGDMIYRPVQAACGTGAVPAAVRRRPGDDRHPGRDGPVRAAEAGAEARGSAAGRRQVEDVLRRPGQEHQVPARRRCRRGDHRNRRR